ncbi:MAG: outer membrane beta-barrel protein, partial [Candidatus Omnitrophica bacterium]|nr:outer membrane beta-barrel protein [Candidatus Omnitrophota bacterium]
VIITGKDGKYHLPAILPGRHLLRIDERTLPGGAYLTTDKVVIIDVTSGRLLKVNFGVNSKGIGTETTELPVKIIQERGKPVPRLNVSLFRDELIIKDGELVELSRFRMFTNYSLFMEKWKLEVRDKDTKSVIKKFEGTRLTLNEPIFWDGKDRNEKTIDPERSYVYVLTVTDKFGRQDRTKEKLIRIVTNPVDEKNNGQISRENWEWIERESKVNGLDKQNIRIEGEVIKLQKQNNRIQNVRILRAGKLESEISMTGQKEIMPSEMLRSAESSGAFESGGNPDIILPKGDYDIEVVGELVRPDSAEPGEIVFEPGEQANVVEPLGAQEIGARAGSSVEQSYVQHIKIGEDYLFFVAMGDVKAGYTFHRGSVEPIQQDDRYREGFWSEAKLAYYLKGKILGKYLITSSLDTSRDKTELFRNLDPDIYYPVYGDTSGINYDATNTQGMLYFLVEWDKSSVLWGDYETAFSGTEFAQFNRTLHGGKVHYESVATTKFGESKTKLVVFFARAKQKAAHNEFVGTGGSLFYLKHSDVTEGSEKIKIEVRDKITGLVLATKELVEDFDYDIKYPTGRITFWQAVSYVAESDLIISRHLLDGNPIYVIVDYEYEPKDKYDEGAYGVRAQQSLTDHLRVGGTYVQEDQLNTNYELKGLDATLRLCENISLTGEYAETESEQLGSFVSTDGGLTFTELSTVDLDKGAAYGLRGEAHFFDKVGLSGYYKKIEKGFSSAATTSQQGKELLGAGLTVDVTSKTRLQASHDIQELIDGGNQQTQAQVGAQKTETSTVQITHRTEKLKLTGEYRHQNVRQKLEQFESETNVKTDAVALKADYKLNEKIVLSLEQQATLSGSPNYQTTAGIEAKLNDKVSLRAREILGTEGAATDVGAAVNVSDRLQLSGNWTKTNYKGGGIKDTASVGGTAKVDDKTDVHTTFAVSDASGGGKTQSIVFGSERKINEQLTATADRTYSKSGDTLTQANTFGLVREEHGRRLEGTFTEQQSGNGVEASCSNIFGLSGDINDKWAVQGAFERGEVQNLDGTLITRNAGSLGLGFVDKDKQTGDVRFKGSSKLEIRLDNGWENTRQYLLDSAIEGKIDPNTSIFAKANFAQTQNTTTNTTNAQYKELVAGAAYRPVNFDRLNLLAKYTYLEDDSPAGQMNFSDIEKEKSHTVAGEAVYDLTDKLQLVEKIAYKQAEEKVSGFDFTKTQTWLLVQRFNYNIDEDWQLCAEYRYLTQKQAEDAKQGALVEIIRNIGEFIQVGVGYNFTDFNDDLSKLDYTSQGPFVRFTGKFYDRTPEEIERARQKMLEENIKQWAWELVQNELCEEDSPVMRELEKYYHFAKKFEAEGNLILAKECYQNSLQIGKMMYNEAEEYVRRRIDMEEKFKEENQLALEYYRQGRFLEARDLWHKIKIEAESGFILMEVEKCAIR